MKSFKEFFEERYLLEYRHKDAFGGIKQSIHANNKKGGNITRDPMTRKIPWNKGPYQKIRKPGEILIGDDLLKELGDLNGVEFQDGKEIKRKNSNQILKLFTNALGQPCGKIVEIKENTFYYGNCVDLVNQFCDIDNDGEYYDDGSAAEWMINVLSDDANVIRISKELFDNYVDISNIPKDRIENLSNDEYYYVINGAGHPNGYVNFVLYGENSNGDDIHYFFNVTPDPELGNKKLPKLPSGYGAGSNM